VHLHPNYLCNIFKDQTGHTVMEHLAMTRVDAAKFLLRRDALPMARVAELAGFPSERSFFRQFRLFTGMPPKAYQTEHRVNQTFCEESYI
jgi:transcriptional regulator GlxA family with amidase domain